MHLSVVILLLVMSIISWPVAAAPVRAKHVSVDIKSENARIAPGVPFWVMVHFMPEEGWHTYWKNPGDSGLAPVLEWKLPAGWQTGDVLYGAPEAIPYGSLVNFGYHGDNALLVQLTPPRELPLQDVDVALLAKWLVCADACVPGSAELTVRLPVAEVAALDSGHVALFEKIRAALPVVLYQRGSYRAGDDTISIDLPAKGIASAALQVFVAPGNVVAAAAPVTLLREHNRLRISATRNTYFSTAPQQLEVVLVAGKKAWSIQAELAQESPP